MATKKENQKEQSLSSHLLSIVLAAITLLLSRDHKQAILPLLALIAASLPAAQYLWKKRQTTRESEDPGEKYLHKGKEADPWERPDKPFPKKEKNP